jgi:CheY-like chemotaxis protein
MSHPRPYAHAIECARPMAGWSDCTQLSDEGSKRVKRNARILIVDDDPDWQDILNVLCVSIGHQPHVVAGFHEALTTLRQTSFDLAMIDLRIDGASDIEIGKALVLHIREHYTDLPVIVISAFAPPGYVRDALLEWGVRDFVEKGSYDSKRVMDMIQRLLSKERGSSSMADSTLQRLLALQAETVALANRMDELDDQLDSGLIDIGRYVKLKAHLDTQRLQLVGQLQLALKGTSASALSQVLEYEKDGDLAQASATLERLAEERGWSNTVREQIEKHKGAMVGLIITIAIEIIRRGLGS